ncbi:EF-hand calcium-binding domain-containing protein 5-like [Pristis pectinata]|uniref:EF-hand calcium-binding domain-containing protein 5-like n=1 Tax=Pristis pectinata TaxID=685728 RepID=UPI00223E6589|nr:EF-hand calcium-binding domain-containing protein 5-like [Pristis pectinata]
MTGAADKDNRNKFHKASKGSVSLASGVTDHGANEDDREDFIGISRPSISIDIEAIKNETHEDQSGRFPLASKRSASIAGVIDHAPEEDFTKIVMQSTKRSYSLGSGAAAAEDRHKGSKAEERKVSISSTAPDVHATGTDTNKITVESVGRSSVHRVPKSPRTRSSFSVHDPSEPLKAKLEAKRASFQTSVIEGFSIRDADEDDEDEGAKNLWKRMFERKVAKRVLNIQEQKTVILQKRKNEKANLEKKIPMDLLAKEWFNENKVTVQTHIYLLEKLLPTLILGLESLLKEVEKRHLTILERPHPYFNPINFLAQFLMRNNPCHRNIPEDDSYLLGLQHVTQDLKNHLTDIKDNRLFYLKVETKQRQRKREQQEKIYAANQEQRREKLRVHFREWMLSTNGIVLLSLVQSVLVSFSEAFADYLFETFEALTVSNAGDRPLLAINNFQEYFGILGQGFSISSVEYPSSLKDSSLNSGCSEQQGQPSASSSSAAKLCYLIPEALHCKSLDRKKFTDYQVFLASDKFVLAQRYKYVYSYIKGLSDGPFADFLVYLSHSSDFFLHKGQKVWWRQRFTELFLECDVGKSGLLNRKRILSLFEEFYDQHAGLHKSELHNPREWPIIELDEMEPADFMLGFGNDYINTQVPTHPPTEEEASTGQKQADVADQLLLHRGLDDGATEKDYVEETGDPAPAKLTPQSLAARFDLTTVILDLQAHSLYLNTSPFKRNFINSCQFVQLMEIFVGNATKPSPKENLINFIKERYKETKEEKLENLAQVYHEALKKTHKIILDALFEKWDNDVSGYIDLRELAEVISKYKDGTEKKSLKKAHHKLKLYRKYNSDNPTLTKREFNVYIETIVAEISGKEDDFDGLVTFLTARSEQNCMERARRRARRRWFYDIKRAAETSSCNMEVVFKSVFQVLYKDSEAHGGNKKISASIALLRHNYHRPERGEFFLHYVACTLEDAPFVLNQALYRDMGVSFAAIDEGKPLHIYRVQDHGKVHFWNCHRERTEGSFLVIPVKDQHNRVFGVLGIDTLRDECGKVFAAHEINFHQGVAKAFSIAYHHVQVRNSILKAVDSAMMWLFNITPNIETAITYLTEPTTVKEYVLCKAMTSENDPFEPWSDVHAPPMILKRKDNFFRNYLFRCADNSEVVFSTTYKGKYICVPLRDTEGRALAILDIDLGSKHELMAHEYRSLLKMLHILNQACTIIVKKATGAAGTLSAASDHEYEDREKVLFHQLMLQEMTENISHLTEQELEELKSSGDPPPMVHKIFKIVFHLVKPKNNVEVLTWSQFKEELNNNLIQLICSFDPIKILGNIKTTLLRQYFKGQVPDVKAEQIDLTAEICAAQLLYGERRRAGRGGVASRRRAGRGGVASRRRAGRGGVASRRRAGRGGVASRRRAGRGGVASRRAA